jgi:hypothetical protein
LRFNRGKVLSVPGRYGCWQSCIVEHRRSVVGVRNLHRYRPLHNAYHPFRGKGLFFGHIERLFCSLDQSASYLLHSEIRILKGFPVPQPGKRPTSGGLFLFFGFGPHEDAYQPKSSFVAFHVLLKVEIACLSCPWIIQVTHTWTALKKACCMIVLFVFAVPLSIALDYVKRKGVVG